MQLSVLPPPRSGWLMDGAVVLIVLRKAYGPPVLAGQTEGLLWGRLGQRGFSMLGRL